MKLRNKLIMSGVALAACAATLTSTTFAWYTTNTQVNATGISGAALESGTSSIYISLDGEEWGQSVDLSSILANNNGLVPLALAGDKLLKNLDVTESGASTGNMSGTAGDGTTVKFTLYFKTAVTNSPVTVYYKNIGLENAEESLTNVDNLLYNITYRKVTSGSYDGGKTYYTYTPTTYTPDDTVTSENFSTKVASGLYVIDGSTYKKLGAEDTFASTTYYTKTAASYTALTPEQKTRYTDSTPVEESSTTQGALNFAEDIAKGILYLQVANSNDANYGVGVDRNQAKYGVDLVKALCMTTKITDDGNADNSDNPMDSFQAYDLQGFATAHSDSNVNMGTANGALNYYNEVMGSSLVKPDTGTAAAKLYQFDTLTTEVGSRTTLCTLPADGSKVAVEFTIFLNGWDEYCYDACKGQRFNMQMSFTSLNS